MHDPTADSEIESIDLWHVLAEHSTAAQTLASELGLPPVLARLLVCRGLGDPRDAAAYLAPGMQHLHDPLEMLGMQAAVQRLRTALTAREPILIYGDYDVDGTVATVLLKTAIERAALALDATADVRYHIPHRIREGYGMQEMRIVQAAAEGVRLVISVDTGIRAFAVGDQARRLGIDLIVTDHHLPDGLGVPDAIAVINPNQPGCPYPYKDLCGAAVAYKLAQALLQATAPDDAHRERLTTKLFPSFLKLLAVATIADSVPLTGENRAIASIGLRELRSPSQAGLRNLMQLAQIDLTRPISAMDIGFRLAPRINAAGRMDIASDVVEMLLTRDPQLAAELAQKLHRLNDDRRATEAEALRAIEVELDTLTASEDGLPLCLVLDDGAADRLWHRGVVGILASRVVDRTGRPALVLTHADGTAYGSGRSIHGFHLLDVITAAHHQSGGLLFTRFGGHAHAVGFALPSDRVPELRSRMNTLAATHSGQALFQRDDHEVTCDAEVRFGEITPDFFASLELLGPFGIGNPEPVFITRGARLAEAIKVVKDRHLRLVFEDAKDGTRFGAMAWARRTEWAALALDQGWGQGLALDIAFRLHHNTHRDFGGWELEVVAMRAARPCSASAPD